MKRRGRPPHPDVLTPREWEVLELVREGLSNEQIAERLGITLRTARYHVSEILSKLGVTSRAEAAAWRPEPRRRWLRALVSLPGVAKVAGAAVVLAAFAGLGVLLWGVLSTGGTADEADATTNLTPAQIVDRSLQAMRELDSFSVEFRAEGTDAWSAMIEWARPDALYSRQWGWEPTGGANIVELVAYGDHVYVRGCDSETECEAWERSPRPPLVPSLDHAAVAFERYPWMLAEMAEGFIETPLGSEIRLAGSVNAGLAYMRHKERALADMESFEVCEEVIGSPPDCYTITGDDVLQEMWDDNPIETLEATPPSDIEVWVSQDDFRIRRVFVALDGENGLFFRYSDFNSVVITPPTDFVVHDE